jgi:leucyl aminopeptidase
VLAAVEAVWEGRDLINTPASDMGPGELELAARALAERHGADVAVVEGEELLTRNFPLIHAVGRASTRAPRLIDLTWGRSKSPLVTLVGKGICFDTGGLDIKPASGMALMKKDMGGAATALTLGHMVMSAKLDVRLRILIPAAENSIAGNAFRPGDVLRARSGTTVEVGNTDAEGRLVLADAIALADEEAPKSLLVFATLTGAARVALGPDVPAFFTEDDAFGAAMVATSAGVGDPVWRLPLWAGYDAKLESQVADINNIWEAPFAGAIVAALFLKRFVKRAHRFAHFDLFGWRPSATPLGPKGGEPQAARAVFAHLQKEFAR